MDAAELKFKNRLDNLERQNSGDGLANTETTNDILIEIARILNHYGAIIASALEGIERTEGSR